MATPKSKSSVLDLNDLKIIWRIVAKNWYIIVIFLSLSYVASLFYEYKLTNVYGVKTQILLKSFEEYNPSAIISDNQGGLYKSYVDNSNEIRVIRSYDLVEQAIQKLKLDVSYFIQGRLKVVEIYEGTPFKIEVLKLNPTFYEKEIKLRIIDPKKFEISYEKGDAEVVKAYEFDKDVVESDFRLIVHSTGAINSKTVPSLKGINYFFKVHSLNALVATYMASMEVTNPEFTNILEITMEDVIPKRAEEFLDTLAEVYINNTLKQRFEVNENTLFYIDRQMEDVVKILNSIEDTMQNFKEEYNILDLTREQSEYFEKLNLYDGERSGLILSIGALDALEDYIIQNKDPEFLPPGIYVSKQDEFLVKSASELYSLQMDKNDALGSATPDNPGLRQLNNKIEMTKKNLLVYIGNARKAFNSKIKDVEGEISRYVASIKTIPEKQRGLLNIQRKQKVNEDMYLFLLQKKANTIISRAGIIPLTKVIETSRPIGLVRPNKKRITLFFIGAGAIISLIIVFIRVFFYEKVESIDELKQKTDLPVLGEILFNSQVKELLIAVESDPRSPITESFRTIRTNLQYMAPGVQSKAIVITSNSPGEGKTFCSINMAAILAKAGKKVLLLELDLHKPRVQRGLDLKSDIGISTILIGKTGIKACVIPTQIENLDVILSGPIPPNASELILSDNMKKIFDYGKEHYHYVIVDTPPVGLISDALVMMSLSDITLFVINTKFSYRESISNAHEIVSTNKVGNFGFILNGIKRKKSKYYYNRYAYGYGYGGRYGYGGYGGSYGGGYGDPPSEK
jgi:tyrosine-protein kinase Etk/Wzc